MKLDNRPKKLLVKDVRGEHVQALRDWFEVYPFLRLAVSQLIKVLRQTTGHVDSLETVGSGDIIIAFKSRAAAEQVRRFLGESREVLAYMFYTGDVERQQRANYWPC